MRGFLKEQSSVVMTKDARPLVANLVNLFGSYAVSLCDALVGPPLIEVMPAKAEDLLVETLNLRIGARQLLTVMARKA